MTRMVPIFLVMILSLSIFSGFFKAFSASFFTMDLVSSMRPLPNTFRSFLENKKKFKTDHEQNHSSDCQNNDKNNDQSNSDENDEGDDAPDVSLTSYLSYHLLSFFSVEHFSFYKTERPILFLSKNKKPPRLIS